MDGNVGRLAMVATMSPVDETRRNDLNWGDDERLFPRLTAWVQRWTQITRLRHVEPSSLTIALLPPLLVVNLGFPFLWGKAVPVRDAAVELRPVLHFRLGWRRDVNSGEYYLSAALKRLPRSMLW